MGSDGKALQGMSTDFIFQSTLPAWGVTQYSDGVIDGIKISIHTPRMGSDLTYKQDDAGSLISIHTPRMGSDHIRQVMRACASISIHTPRMGSDLFSP